MRLVFRSFSNYKTKTYFLVLSFLKVIPYLKRIVNAQSTALQQDFNLLLVFITNINNINIHVHAFLTHCLLRRKANFIKCDKLALVVFPLNINSCEEITVLKI